MASLSLDAFKSPSDKKQYRVITLENGLEALLIHGDPLAQNDGGGADEVIGCSGDSDGELREPEDEDDLLFRPRRSTVSHSGGYDTESDTGSDDDGDDADSDDEDSGDDASSNSSRDGGRAVVKGTPHAAACLSVAVGSMADPQDMRGLAHYLEHMLFMGSAKYPDENEFESFLSTHGGYSNGTTECESTRYLFEVAPGFLRGALDMFAQFFVAPLFKEEAMDRELLAIESEFNRARQNDYVRLQQVQCETSAPESLYNSFSWGNTASLHDEPLRSGRNVRDEMMAFYKTHYSADRMKLCVYGEDSLDDLEAWVRESFMGIPTNLKQSSPSPAAPPPPFGEAAGQAPTLIKIVPVRKMHAMHLYWPLPPQLHNYRQKPWEFLSHAMGHEATGSLSAILKDRMWATEVSVGISESDAYEFGSFGSLFEVNVSLTKTGLAHWQAVVSLVFDVVSFVTKQALTCPWIFQELKAASKMNFQFQEESHPLSLCKRLAELLQARHGVERAHLLSYDVLHGEFDAEMTRALLTTWMTPQNTRVLLLSHSFEAEAEAVDLASWRREKWLDVQYSIESIPATTINDWQHHYQGLLPPAPRGEELLLSLPERNPFMPEQFTVLPLPLTIEDPHGEPVLTHVTSMSKLWYKRDVLFLTPKTTANFLFCLPSLTANVSNYIHAKVYLRLCHEALQKVQYHAYLANYSYDLCVRDLDIEVTFSGFSDKLPALIHAVMDALLHTPVDDAAVLERVRSEMVKEYRNLNLKPAVKARYMRLQLLERTTFPIEDKLRVLEQVTCDEIAHFKASVLWQCEASIRAMVHGNISQQDAQCLLEKVENALDTHTKEQRLPALLSPRRPHTTALPLTTNGLLLRDVSDHEGETNSIVEVYYQFGHASYDDHAYAELLQHVMAEPLFHKLRTTQQLGYEVFCMVRETHGVLGFSISVQSASHAAGEIAKRVDQFVHHDFLLYLGKLQTSVLHKHVASLQRMKTREDAAMSDESDRYWEEIQSRRLEFRIDDHVVQSLMQCTVAGLLERYSRWLLTAQPVEGDTNTDDAVVAVALQQELGTLSQVRKLRVHVIGKSSKFVQPLESLVSDQDAPLLIDNWRAYKAALACHCAHESSHRHRRRTGSSDSSRQRGRSRTSSRGRTDSTGKGKLVVS